MFDRSVLREGEKRQAVPPQGSRSSKVAGRGNARAQGQARVGGQEYPPVQGSAACVLFGGGDSSAALLTAQAGSRLQVQTTAGLLSSSPGSTNEGARPHRPSLCLGQAH